LRRRFQSAMLRGPWAGWVPGALAPGSPYGKGNVSVRDLSDRLRLWIMILGVVGGEVRSGAPGGLGPTGGGWYWPRVEVLLCGRVVTSPRRGGGGAVSCFLSCWLILGFLFHIGLHRAGVPGTRRWSSAWLPSRWFWREGPLGNRRGGGATRCCGAPRVVHLSHASTHGRGAAAVMGRP